VTKAELATVALWSYGLATFAFVAFGFRLALGRGTGMRAALLLSATLVTAAWAAACFLAALRPGPVTWRIGAAADVLRYAAWFVFVASLLKGSAAKAPAHGLDVLPRWVVALVVVTLVACLAVPTSPLFGLVSEGTDDRVALGMQLGLAVFGLFLIEQLLRRVDAAARWALRPLCIGLAGMFAFDLYLLADAMLFGRLDPQIWAARGAANAFVIPFVAVTTARNPSWSVELHVSRVAVFHSTAILLSGLFLLLVAFAGYIVRFIGGNWGRALQIEVVFVALLVGALVASSGRFRAALRVFISKHFFSYRYDYREEWLRFTHTLAPAHDVREVQERAVRALADLVESPAGALWVRDDDGVYRPAARWNMPAIEASEVASGSLVRFLAQSGWIVDLAEYQADRARYGELAAPQWLIDAPSAWLVVPLLSATGLVAFVVLAKPRAEIEVNWEVRDLLKVASRQAASYLDQVRATEALVEARKFDAFNRMSAFVVHDLKNLVAQLSLMLKNAERHRDNPEFQKDMLATIEHALGRMNRLMLQLRSGATPVGNPRVTNLEPIVRDVCALHAKAHAAVELEIEPGLVAIGHEDRLGRVIGHLVQNAIDATGPGGCVKVRLYRQEPFSVVEVVDTGVGMSPEFIRKRLFKPFETSKTTGMGIGVYESAQYVSSLGGQILYDSKVGAGTSARLLLPATGAIAATRAEAVA